MNPDPLIEILKSDLSRKRARNAAYSLRSYSRDLAVDPSNLSKLLSYRKPLGQQLRARLAKRIGLSPDAILTIGHETLNIRDQDYRMHGAEAFQLVADWQHYAILELLKVKTFKVSPQSIATSLGLTVIEAKTSLERLKKSGMLTKDSEGRLKPSEESSSSILSIATSKAHREQQKQILEGAIDALEKVAIEERSQSSMTFAVDTAKLDEARALIKKFRRQMGRLLSDGGNLNEVYQLSISLYPVTNQQRRNRK